MLLMAACGSGPTASVGSPSPSSNSTPTPASSPTSTSSPAPLGLCSPSNPCLALVTLRGSDALVVRDITDINHPKTVASVGKIPSGAFPGTSQKFVNENTISYYDGDHIMRSAINGGRRSIVATIGLAVGFDWSPDGQTLAYMTQISRERAELHLVGGGQDRLVDTVPGLPDVLGCESLDCADRWDFAFGYSNDGRYISWAQNVTNVVQVWTSEGQRVKLDVTSLPFMTVWSDSGFYYRDAKGIEVFRNGAASPFMPGVAWMFPDASPDGRAIVYENRDEKGVAHVVVVDSATAHTRDLASHRAYPAFLTSRYVWYRAEAGCAAPAECVGPTGAGKAYIYDLQTGTEYESVITQLFDVWAHAA